MLIVYTNPQSTQRKTTDEICQTLMFTHKDNLP